ncbi:uncharacterized protein LOC119381883 [Rhipicephalus sanguineus]|uniref:uncharacterized protein LOC119381883 n=1 Tax=Rhipicephalus sanguineus TaxID=34632 RepID=UPI001895753E|nr:uncharacterized protein LOC119381883 [Rhipicephalus sanguineus]
MPATLLSWTSGKLRQQPVETAASCQLRGHHIFVPDQVSKRGFLIDCGSDICCFPRPFLHDKRPCTSFELSAVNHSSIKTYGRHRLNITLKNLRREFPWNFVIADVGEPIIGSDFLAHYHLLPDCRHDRLIDATTGLSAPGQRTTTQQPSVKAFTVEDQSPYHAILAEFPDLTRPSGRPRDVRHSTVHYIRTTPGPPVSCRARRLAPDRLRIAQAEFEAMLREGTARRSEGPYASPLHLVRKKTDGCAPVEIITPSTPVQSQTGTPFVIYRILPTAYTAAPYSQLLTW